MQENESFQSEFYSHKVVAGKRTYFFDVKETKDGTRFLVINELSNQQRHKIFVYKEHFADFMAALEDVKPHVEK